MVVDGLIRIVLIVGYIWLIGRSKEGTERVKQIVRDLRTFSRMDQAELGDADLNEELERTLDLMESRFKGGIHLERDLGELVTAEVTPNHLFLSAPECYERYGSLAQMNPPVRGRRHLETIREALADGTIVGQFPTSAQQDQIGAVLDRNGLRPSRYYVTKDDRVILASETGVLDIPPERVEYKGRLQPGRMLLIDTAEGHIVSDEEIKHQVAGEQACVFRSAAGCDLAEGQALDRA